MSENPQGRNGPPFRSWDSVLGRHGGKSLSASLRNVRPLRIQARYGEPIVLRIHNAFPVANQGFGINQTTTHHHNGHHGSESDGGPVQFYDTGHYKDFRYANARAGFASTHPMSSLNGHSVIVHETMSFLWFHDHCFSSTAQNVHKGLVGCFTYYCDDIALDTADETTGLRLPSGEYDIPMIFIDRTFDPAGQLFFDLFNLDGILGTKYTVNGKIQPFLEVKRRKYPFRILDGGPSRVYQFFLGTGRPFIQITNDGNLLPRPLTWRSLRLGVGERADVVVDFSSASLGDTIYLQNRLEQTSGRGPTGKIIAPANLLQFRVMADAPDDSQVPATLLDLPQLGAPVRMRRWDFGRHGGAWVINGEPFDPTVIRAFPIQDTADEWVLNSGGGWMHPIHIHQEEFQITSRGKGVPVEERSRKDIVCIGEGAVGTDNTEARVFHLLRDWLGDYPMHCLNTIHIRGYLYDNTAHKVAEQALREAELRNRNLIEFLPDAVLVAEAETILFAKPAAAQLVGARRPDELVARRLLDFFHLDSHPAMNTRMHQALHERILGPSEHRRIVRLDSQTLDEEPAVTIASLGRPPGADEEQVVQNFWI